MGEKLMLYIEIHRLHAKKLHTEYCGVLSHHLRTIEPVNAKVRARSVLGSVPQCGEALLC